MARNLTITLGTSTYAVAPVKVERSKLYGSTEMRVTTIDGHTCHVAGINGDGITIVDPGCTKTGMITEDGLWMERDELRAVKADGSEVPEVESSFNCTILPTGKATMEDLLSINVTSVYQLTGYDTLGLVEAVGDEIYTFPFSYRGGYEHSPAFLLATDSALFIVVGTPAALDFIGIDESGVLDDEIDDNDFEDELDFSMM